MRKFEITMIRYSVTLLALFFISSSFLFSQEYDGFRFLKRVRGLKLPDSKIEELKLEETSQNLIVSYRERKVSYISIIKLGSWDKVNDFRIDETATLYASYFGDDGFYYLNTDIYKLIYRKIDVNNGVVDTLECTQTPNGCQSIDSRMPDIEVRSSDGFFIYQRDKDHPNDVLVYMDNIQFNKVKEEMEAALKRDVYVREVKEKLENDARKEQMSDFEPKQVAKAVSEVAKTQKQSYQITQDDILKLMATGRFEKGGVVMTLTPGLKVKVDNSNVSTLDEPSQTYFAGDIIKLETIQFEQGKSEISATSFAELDKLVSLLGKKSTMQVQINGHTNNVGTHNMEVSEDRAKAVVEYLISKGIEDARLRYRGFGDLQPIASNDTPEGLAQNRRVEIEIIKQ